MLEIAVVVEPGAIANPAAVRPIAVGVLMLASGAPPPETLTIFTTDGGLSNSTSTGIAKNNVSSEITFPEYVHVRPSQPNALPRPSGVSANPSTPARSSVKPSGNKSVIVIGFVTGLSAGQASGTV